MRQSLTTSERLLSGRLSRFLGFECGISPVRSQRRMMARFDPLGRYSDGEVDDTDEGNDHANCTGRSSHPRKSGDPPDRKRCGSLLVLVSFRITPCLRRNFPLAPIILYQYM
jgi:hypothetical protein